MVEAFGLGGRVAVLRSRAEALPGGQWDVATARAVAPLPRLLPWLAPLVRPGGSIVAFKGEGAAREVAEAAGIAAHLRLLDGEVRTIGADVVSPPTTVVRYVTGTRSRSRPGAVGGGP